MATNDSLIYRPSTITPNHKVMTYCSDGAAYHIHITAYGQIENNIYYWHIAYAVNGNWSAVPVVAERRSIHSYDDALVLGAIWAESKVHRMRIAEIMRSPQSWQDRLFIICHLLKHDPVLSKQVYAVYPRSGQPYVQIVANKNELGGLARAIKPYSKGILIDWKAMEKQA